MQLFSFKAEL